MNLPPMPKIPKTFMQAVVAIAILFGFLSALGYMLTDKTEPVASAQTMLEALKAAMLIAVGYYLGSSASSARKTELMETKE